MTNCPSFELHVNKSSFIDVPPQKLLEEILSQNDAIEELNDACEQLVELSACSKVRDQTIDVQSNYTKLLTAAQGKWI